MTPSKIVVINESRVSDDAAKALVAALGVQVSRDLAPAWGIPAVEVSFLKKTANLPAGAWPLVLLEDSDQANALGYHDVTKGGAPMGKSFVGSSIDDGCDWATTTSHELCELLIDPTCDLVVNTVYAGKQVMVLREVCDPCEGDCFAYPINGIEVSDFVFPAYFDVFSPRSFSTQFDQCRDIHAPMTLLSEGYFSIYDTHANAGWQQVYGDLVSPRRRVLTPGSRRERFFAGRHRWAASTTI